MIETAIRTLLLADVAVRALVGTRVYSGLPPQRPTAPYVQLWKVDRLSGLTLDGVPTLSVARIQVDCYAGDHDAVRTLAAAVNGDDGQTTKGPLHGYVGTVAGVRINRLELSLERGTQFEEDTKLYRVSADYLVRL